MTNALRMLFLAAVAAIMLFVVFWRPGYRLETTVGIGAGALFCAVVILWMARRWNLRKSTWAYVAAVVAGAFAGIVFSIFADWNGPIAAFVGAVSLPAILFLERRFGSKDYEFIDSE